MSVRGNSGFVDTDKRFGSSSGDTKGIIQREQQFLERTQGRFEPVSNELAPAENPTAWYDADSTYITLNGSDVSQWDDKSGNDIHMSQSTTSAQPPYSSSNSSLNNLPSVDAANNQWMESSDNALLDTSTTGGFTVYVVAVKNSQPSTFAFLCGRTNTTTWSQGWGIFLYSGNIRFFVNNWNSSATRAETTIPANGSTSIYKMHYDETTITAEIIGDGADSGTQAYSTPVTDTTGTEGLLLNAGNSTAYDGDFDFGEYIFYNRPLTADEQTETENYLKNKFNIS